MKLKLGKELTKKMRTISAVYGISLQEIARRAMKATVGYNNAPSTLPCTKGTVIDIDASTMSQDEIRKTIYAYCMEHEPSEEAKARYFEDVNNELYELKRLCNELKRTHGIKSELEIGLPLLNLQEIS